MTSIWKKETRFSPEDCIFYNFGYEKPTPFAQISFDLESEISFSLKVKGIGAPNTCSLVLIAGKYLDKLDEVMEKVDQIVKSTESVPIAVYLFKAYKDQEVKLYDHKRCNNSIL